MKSTLYYLALAAFMLYLVIESELSTLEAVCNAKVRDPLVGSLWNGETAEAYSVSGDNKLIGTSRFPERLAACEGVIDTHGVREALKGNEGWWAYPDYGGTLVIGKYAPSFVNDEPIAVVAERDLLEVMQARALAVVALLGFAFVGYFKSRAGGPCGYKN